MNFLVCWSSIIGKPPLNFKKGEEFKKKVIQEKLELILNLVKLNDWIFLYAYYCRDYGKDELKISAPAVRGYILEGSFVPAHFDGVLQVVMKLLNIVYPAKAYFGKKDAQQLFLIKEMVKSYFMRVEIVACNTPERQRWFSFKQ